jgi:hypothetical protein
LLKVVGDSVVDWAIRVGFLLVIGGLVAAVIRSYHLGWQWTLAPGIGAGLLAFGGVSIAVEHWLLPWQTTCRANRELARRQPLLNLADEADELSVAILAYEQRDPEGNSVLSPIEAARRMSDLRDTPEARYADFDKIFGQQLRRLFPGLLSAGLVEAGELSLFDSPRKSENRVFLAQRLRQAARSARHPDLGL